jgi:hypothetical protein
MRASVFRALTCQSSSRHRPHGTRMRPSALTATIRSTSDSLPLSMSATAACSAQNPKPQLVSIQMPVYTLPARVMRAAATLPATHSPLVRNSPAKLFATWINSPSVMIQIRYVRSVGLTDLGFSRAVPRRAEADARDVTPNEARKRRANKRHRVGCYAELDGRLVSAFVAFRAPGERRTPTALAFKTIVPIIGANEASGVRRKKSPRNP